MFRSRIQYQGLRHESLLEYNSIVHDRSSIKAQYTNRVTKGLIQECCTDAASLISLT